MSKAYTCAVQMWFSNPVCQHSLYLCSTDVVLQPRVLAKPYMCSPDVVLQPIVLDLLLGSIVLKP